MIAALSRVLAAITPLVLAVTLCTSASADPPTFEANAEKAVEQVAPELEPAEPKKLTGPSGIDPSQQVITESVAFRDGKTSLLTSRDVGAVAPVENGTPTGRGVSSVVVKRAKVGPRRVVITDTSTKWGPGQLIAKWTERTGVNYSVAWRADKLDRNQLIELIKALPADTAKPTRRALRAIKAGPRSKRSAERSASSRFVEGGGSAKDDLNDESDLCNGCSYSNSNYVFLWQQFLSADGYPPAGGSDCWFGSGTANATKAWKQREGLPADGYFGQSARSRAGSYLIEHNASGAGWVVYNGINWDPYVWRDGRYKINDKQLAYSWATIC